MSLGWKDAAATVLTAGAIVVTYAKVKGFDWPLLGSWRMASAVLLVIGLGTCILIGSDSIPAKNVWTTSASILGGLAFLLAVANLLFNNQVVFLTLASDIVILWAITTLHHLVATGS